MHPTPQHETVTSAIPTSHKEDGWGQGFLSSFGHLCTVLDEASKGRDTGACAEHHDWRTIWFEWEAELLVGWLDSDSDGITGFEGTQVRASHANELAVTGIRSLVDDAVGDGTAGCINERGRGD